ncbi:MAG: aldo/keto reductase [Desulfatiglandaceae bacterium]
MKYKMIGNTGVKVSCLCLGTMSFAGTADKEQSTQIFNRCRGEGINFIDCANIYSAMKSEALVGQLLEGCRDEFVLATKVGHPFGDGPEAGSLSRRHIMHQVEKSLKRLRTDRIDFYFVHWFYEDIGMEETLRTLDDLVRQGKILYPAVSNWAAWQITKALGISTRQGWDAFRCIQPMYSLLKRQAEVEIFPLAQSEDLGVMTYSPLGGGMLTGKYTDGPPPEKGRIRDVEIYAKRYADESNLKIAADFVSLARKKGFDPPALAVAWTMAHSAVTCPIIGARKVEHLDAYLQAMKIEMTEDLYQEISALTPAPPVATDRSEERYGPVKIPEKV